MSSPLRTTLNPALHDATPGGRHAGLGSEATRATIYARVAALLHRVHLPDIEMPAAAANEPDIHQSKLLERYY